MNELWHEVPFPAPRPAHQNMCLDSSSHIGLNCSKSYHKTQESGNHSSRLWLPIALKMLTPMQWD